MKLKKEVQNAILIGVMCSIAYLAVYIARNVLSAVSPQMIESDAFGTDTQKFIGNVSSTYFITYALGQLINGAIGDKIKGKYMIAVGLLMAGVTNFLFAQLSSLPNGALVIYAMTGFFLAMVYAPMTKIVAENTEPIYATRCSLGYTFASFLGSPLAGVLASVLVWQSVFIASSAVLILMACVCFFVFTLFERKGIVRYGQYKPEKQKGAGFKVLLKHRIVKFSLIAVLTGVVRTSVVFWMPTYIAQYLGFSSSEAASIFTVATFVICFTTFIAVFIYEKLHRDMDKTILLMFSCSALFFLSIYLVKIPLLNIILLVLAVMSSNGAASMLWSRYCPSLRDTGIVSGVTGFLDFLSYMGAAISSTLFANAVASIGWKNLILVWMGLMFVGVAVALPYEKIKAKSKKAEAVQATATETSEEFATTDETIE